MMGAPARSARQLFAEEVRRPDPEIGLARAALLIAKEEYPQISVEQYVARLDQLAEEVKGRLGEETAPLMVLQEMLQVVYGRHGFRGNANAYYDPRNSFFNDVLDRRLGIPLTLGFVLLEVGWRLELPLQGVNFPDHFLVRFQGDVLDLLIDPFDGGKLRFQDQAQEFLDRVYGGRVKMRESFLREATKRDMLMRMLHNLRSVYVNVGDSERARWVGERLDLLRYGAGGPTE
jgi:regulator of sirC expression with transglutaminase-like and TPR domain